MGCATYDDVGTLSQWRERIADHRKERIIV